MANCSLPFTTINCYQGKKLLKFTNVSQSNCSDGRTFSNIRTLRYSDFSGSVVCWFTIGKIFMEYRLLHFESENSFRRHLTDEPLRLIASITFFTALIAVGYFLFGKLRSRMKILTRGNGKDSTHRNFTTEILLRGLYFALIIATIFPLVIPCQMRIEKHLKYKQDEDTFISICIVAIIFGIFSIPLFFAWLIAFYKLYKMGQQMETVTGEDSQQRNRNSAIVPLYVPLPEFIVMIVALIFSCRKCEQGAGCPTCLLASVVSILLLSIALFYWLKKRTQIRKWERAKKYLIDICVVTIRLLEGILMFIAVPFLWIRSRLQTMSQRLTRKKVTEREFRDPEVNPLSNEDPGHL
ncbi:uncharacterized protein LOC106873011 [Octopus bimaculoides]|uniref:Uncharacterized protein n=1 Tax=Octopus bimaculoides TaxID=37653 RepID=A0A0L8H3I4_OCTBM|nr:uncharacterized protein LOC106873011 [Octopus bimaculoides]XP_014775696.1 uncharacterized protein LOC106873011 [Octopus bimaculoides]|eukprot:XP_014775695.1 PREDICTED: uncharacterized protein LOC106873011 [Octopus bimaculoides]